MKQFNLVGSDVKVVLKGNVLAVLSDRPLTVTGSAFHNGGGLKKTKAILNVQVPETYGDHQLHEDPEAFIMAYSKKFGLAEESFVGMITAAAVENFALISKKNGNLAVSVIATAADTSGKTCSHAESAGETIEIKEAPGTINIIIIIDGNPTESCLVSTLITATEAKIASLRELDIRSRYSGAEATGTVTDAIVAAETNRGAPVLYGGPASELGQLVGYCTRKAVKEAIMKADDCMPCRSILNRLKERHLSIEKLASELSKVKSLGADEKTIASNLVKILQSDSLSASVVMAAVKMDEDIEKGLIPPEFGKIEDLSKNFGEIFSKQTDGNYAEYNSVDLPLFLKHVLIGMIKKRAFHGETTDPK